MSLSRGNDPGYDSEFVFTLTGANISDSGIYEVEVEVTHPSTNALYIITKTFYVTCIIIIIRDKTREPMTTTDIQTDCFTNCACAQGNNSIEFP